MTLVWPCPEIYILLADVHVFVFLHRRSPPHGRTVLYNPQMQSLVVQTTVGPDSHPMVCMLGKTPCIKLNNG